MALALSGLSFDGGTTWVESEDRLVTYMLPARRVPRVCKVFPNAAVEGIPQTLLVTGGLFDSFLDNKAVAVCDFEGTRGSYAEGKHWRVPVHVVNTSAAKCVTPALPVGKWSTRSSRHWCRRERHWSQGGRVQDTSTRIYIHLRSQVRFPVRRVK